MAKALYGHLGSVGNTQHETAVLRRRVRDLEDEVLRLNRENDRLRADHRLDVDHIIAEELLESVGR